jgi:hypothetical protein
MNSDKCSKRPCHQSFSCLSCHSWTIPQIFIIFLLFSSPAFAIYKCTSNGKVTYSDVLCLDGSTLVIPTAPASSSLSQAKLQLEQQKTEVNRLEKERHKQATKEEHQQRQLTRIDASKQKKCTSLALHRKWATEDASNTSIKAAEKARRKARRAEEKYILNCA